MALKSSLVPFFFTLNIPTVQYSEGDLNFSNYVQTFFALLLYLFDFVARRK